ncbi:aldehyde dehydrogenase, dimeric NADP-preferring-like [Euwallacea fornicatus]|uniref:aldehyde dehydrogenase, dimeric NADP-preferring-like n=1 Tax=Euwallacea fornicatus TaxID=995702 RepID=UPI00338F47E7
MMVDGEYILPRVENSCDQVAVIDMEMCSDTEKQSATYIVAQARKAFNSGKTQPYEFRKAQLEGVRMFLEEHSHGLCSALYSDLRKPKSESYMHEIGFLIVEINDILRYLKDWMKPEVPKKPLLNFFDDIRIYSDPLGVVLVMGAWNYPLHLTLCPVLGAIAGGNCCVIKPSDLSTHTSRYIADFMPKYVDKDCYPVFLGGVPETTDLLKEKFDYIFYTGSTAVGKIIHKAAANFLTPTTLELGGKSPTYIDSTADIEVAIKRIVWGKFTNAGQTCVAPDYILCTRDVQDEVVKCAENCIKNFFGDNVKQSEDFARIINERHFIRVCNLLKNQNVAIGGEVDAQDLYIAPTILVDVHPDSDVMKEEIFGPILPIVNVESASEAVEFINKREKPLAMYIFTKDRKTKNYFLRNTSSGGVCINDTLMHLAVSSLPFGGVGNSGMGNYHGKKSFDIFVHKKSVLMRSYNSIGEKLQEIRYPPYTERARVTLQVVTKNLNRSVNFTGYLYYGLAFGLGVGITVGGFYLKNHFYCNDL